MKLVLPIAAAVLAAAAIAGPAAACALQTVGELDVDLSRGLPVVDGEINGVGVKIGIDTGASHTLITPQTAAALGLSGSQLAGGYVAQGIGGATESYVSHIRTLKIGSMTATDLPPILISGAQSNRFPFSMLLGADFLSQFDLELDLPEHVIRLFKGEDCKPGQLVYWNKPYSQAALVPPPNPYAFPQIQTEITLNGRRALAEVDSGSTRTLVNAEAAAAAGEPPPTHPELIGGGLGPDARLAWTDEFASVGIGDENIARAKVEVEDFGRDFQVMDEGVDTRIAQRNSAAPQVLIGDDFLTAHRVMVDFAHHVMVFSYNGGPIFEANAPRP